MAGYYFHKRISDSETPAGFTVTKSPELPEGNFRITEYSWPDLTLWFLDEDEFNADERQEAYMAVILSKEIA